MKLGRLLGEAGISESALVIEDYDEAVLELETMLEDIQEIRELLDNGSLKEDHIDEVNAVLNDIAELTGGEEFDKIFEAVQRQFRRYGDKFLRQYRRN